MFWLLLLFWLGLCVVTIATLIWSAFGKRASSGMVLAFWPFYLLFIPILAIVELILHAQITFGLPGIGSFLLFTVLLIVGLLAFNNYRSSRKRLVWVIALLCGVLLLLQAIVLTLFALAEYDDIKHDHPAAKPYDCDKQLTRVDRLLHAHREAAHKHARLVAHNADTNEVNKANAAADNSWGKLRDQRFMLNSEDGDFQRHGCLLPMFTPEVSVDNTFSPCVIADASGSVGTGLRAQFQFQDGVQLYDTVPNKPLGALRYAYEFTSPGLHAVTLTLSDRYGQKASIDARPVNVLPGDHECPPDFKEGVVWSR